MTIESNLACKIMYSININDIENVDKFYDEYLIYTRQILKGNFDKDNKNKLMYVYANYLNK